MTTPDTEPRTARTPTGEPAVSLRGLTKVYGGRTVVDAVDLDIAAGEFFSLLGPSGCGKTTTLRMVGGFTDPSAGTIRVGGVDVTTTPPQRRDVNTVFQSYALFEHLDVRGNVAFGLRRKGVDRRTDAAARSTTPAIMIVRVRCVRTQCARRAQSLGFFVSDSLIMLMVIIPPLARYT
jgi:spermidine/putrescine transport system ATP-binding protein